MLYGHIMRRWSLIPILFLSISCGGTSSPEHPDSASVPPDASAASDLPMITTDAGLDIPGSDTATPADLLAPEDTTRDGAAAGSDKPVSLDLAAQAPETAVDGILVDSAALEVSTPAGDSGSDQDRDPFGIKMLRPT